MANYVTTGYVSEGYVQTGIVMNWPTRVIFIPRVEMTVVQTTPTEVRELDANVFRLALKNLEDTEQGMVNPNTHNNYPPTTVGGVTLARVIELINNYTVTFEDGQYAVNIVGANTNIADKVNPNQVSVRSANSAGLIQTRELEQASYNSKVYIDTVNGTDGTLYPIGTLQRPVKTLADAKFIAAQRGLDLFYLKSNITIGATDDVTALRFEGDGATLNVTRTLVTLTQGCITTNSRWAHCRMTGYQGGESLYHNCIIDGLENAHCIYEQCGMIDGTSRGWTIKQTSSESSGHASYFKECFSDEATFILDRNGARSNVTFDGFHGRVKIINQNHATSSGQVWFHLNGGTVTIDSTCTKGQITVTGFGTLVNNSLGTEVDASGFAAEVAIQAKIDTEALRSSHQSFGARWYVDPVTGNDLSSGTSPASPLATVTAAIAKAVSGRGDVIYLIAPATGAVTINERVNIDKEDIHVRGPSRGVQFQPSTTNLGPVITISGNNCSLSGFIVRAPAGSTTDDCIVVSGKFSKMHKLYVVGAGQTVGTGSGIVFTHGDYHELIDCESEKCGRSGLLIKDLSGGTGNGSPREISVKGGNWYLNGKDGIEFEGTANTGAGTSNRLNRILNANIHDNLGYGIRIDGFASGTVIGDEVFLHTNTTGNILDAGLNTYNALEEHDTGIVNGVWNATAADYNTALTMGAKVNAAGTAGDPWGADLSGYAPGTAGEAVYNMPADVWVNSTRTLTSTAVTSSAILLYKASNTTTDSDPGAGRFRWNNSTQSSATRLYLDFLTEDGIDIENYVNHIIAGSELYLQDKDDASKYQKWLIGSTVVNVGYLTLNVVLTTSGGGNIANNAVMALRIKNTADVSDSGDPWAANLSAYPPGSAGAVVLDTNTVVNAQIDGLTPTQTTMLLEMYELLGLDPLKPLVVTKTARTAGTISQTITATDIQTTVQRN